MKNDLTTSLNLSAPQSSSALMAFLMAFFVLFSAFSPGSQLYDALFIDANGNVGIGKQSQGEKLEVAGNIKSDGLMVTGFSANSLVPKGAILMWNGKRSSIPSGWALCDGSNGTPDLRSRFIVGFDDRTFDPGGNFWDSGYNNNGYIGGQLDITLTINNMPAHKHTGTTDTDGNHQHTWNGYRQKCVCAGQSGVKSQEKIDTDPTDWATNIDGAHSHSFTTNTTGGGSAFDGRPPFFTLAYIIKL
jgi:hypothetical protein